MIGSFVRLSSNSIDFYKVLEDVIDYLSLIWKESSVEEN